MFFGVKGGAKEVGVKRIWQALKCPPEVLEVVLGVEFAEDEALPGDGEVITLFMCGVAGGRPGCGDGTPDGLIRGVQLDCGGL